MVDFILDVDLVKFDNTLLQLLVVAQVVVQGVIDVILELTLYLVLFANLILDFLQLLL